MLFFVGWKAMPNEKITVVVPVWNSRPYLKACLDSTIAAMRNYGPAELIVIDNGSTDGSYEMLNSDYGLLARIYQIRDATISALRNYGARVGSGEYLSFIDSDCTIPEDYFHRVMAVFSSIATDAAGCMYELPPTPHWIEKTWQELHERPEDGYVNLVNSGNLIVKAAVFEQSGGFDESLVTGEDAEFCQRLITAGFHIYESHDISAVHLGNPKTLVAFFRKQVWQGLGMFGTAKLSWLDKPLLMTLVFLVLSAIGIAELFFASVDLRIRVGTLVLFSTLVPALTVGYRAANRGRLRRPLRSILLYWVYYAGRVYALFLILFRHMQAHE